MLTELGVNAERTGVPADPRTGQRLIRLLGRLNACRGLLDRLAKQADSDYGRSELRMVQGSLGSVRDEAKRVAERLRIDPEQPDSAAY